MLSSPTVSRKSRGWRRLARSGWFGGMNLIVSKHRLSARTNLPTMRRVMNLALQDDGARDTARLSRSNGNLAPDAASGTDELSAKHSSSLNATTNAKRRPLRHSSVDVRQQLRDVGSELLLALGDWTLNVHTATRVMPPNFYYTTGGSYIEMRFKPDSWTCKQFIINQTSLEYTAAGSFIKGA